MSDELKIAALSLLLDKANQKPLPQVMQDVASEWLAERDTTPVDADWLDRVMGPRHMSPLHGYLEWRSANSEIEVTIYADGSSTVSDGESSYCYIDNPTRGDVLTALRLFREKRK